MATLRSGEIKKAGLMILSDDIFVLRIYEGSSLIGTEMARAKITGDNVLELRDTVEFAVEQGTTITRIDLVGLIRNTNITTDDDLYFENNGIYVVNSFQLIL